MKECVQPPGEDDDDDDDDDTTLGFHRAVVFGQWPAGKHCMQEED